MKAHLRYDWCRRKRRPHRIPVGHSGWHLPLHCHLHRLYRLHQRLRSEDSGDLEIDHSVVHLGQNRRAHLEHTRHLAVGLYRKGERKIINNQNIKILLIENILMHCVQVFYFAWLNRHLCLLVSGLVDIKKMVGIGSIIRSL